MTSTPTTAAIAPVSSRHFQPRGRARRPITARAAIDQAVRLARNGRKSAAYHCCCQALHATPDDVAVLKLATGLALELSRVDDAHDLARDLIVQAPDDGGALLLLGIAKATIGEYAEALDAYRLIIETDAAEAREARLNAADILLSNSEPDPIEAEQLVRPLVEANPDDAGGVSLLSLALRQQDRFDEEADVLRDYVERSSGIRHERLFYLGDVLSRLRRWSEAVPFLTEAAEQEPGLPKYLWAVAAAAYNAHMWEVSRKWYTALLDVTPDDSGAMLNLATVYSELNEPKRSEELMLKVLEDVPDSSINWNNYAIHLAATGRHGEALESFRKAMDLDPRYRNAFSNYLFNINYAQGYSPETIAAEHARYGETFEAPLQAANVVRRDRDPDRRLRIGYVSADFFGHVVSYFLQAPYNNHDRTRFEIFSYANNSMTDTRTNTFREQSDHWRSIAHIDTREVCEIIRADEIDILVDLSGHTAGNRMDVFAEKPAPIQMTWLGYPNSTGLKHVDYRIVDAITDPPGAEALHTEKLLRLPDGFISYRPNGGMPDFSHLPAETAGHITFGCFNKSNKITEQALRLWSAILRRVPDSRLLIKNKGLMAQTTCDWVQGILTEEGIDTARVRLLGQMPTYDQHIALYGEVDIALDTFPYNGTTTTCEALWMQAPVIAMLGDRHCARVSASILHQLDLDELVGENDNGYVERAVSLAQDRDRLRILRATMRERMGESTLLDHVRMTRQLEDAYRMAWRTYCDSADARLQEEIGHG